MCAVAFFLFLLMGWVRDLSMLGLASAWILRPAHFSPYIQSAAPRMPPPPPAHHEEKETGLKRPLPTVSMPGGVVNRIMRKDNAGI